MKENTKDITASEEQMSDEISSLTTPDFKLTLHIKTNNGTNMLREGIHLMYLKAGDTLRVVETGRSTWDAMDYADCKTDKGYTVEIMKNYADFELVC